VTTLDFGDQFLQVASALDPAHARTPPDSADTDTNDLQTINVYTVGCSQSRLLSSAIS
jgi:hypothetical protein